MTSLASTFIKLSLVGVALVGGAVGCAGQGPATDAETTEPEALSSPHIKTISASGLGCQSGAYDWDTSDDGASATVTFDNFVAGLEPGLAFGLSDCTVTVRIKAPAGVQYAIDSLSTEGDAAIESDSQPDVARETLGAYFMGSPPPANHQTLDVTRTGAGPISLGGDLADDQLAWSSCTAVRDLEVQTRLELSSAAHDVQGQIAISALKLRVRFRRCAD
jgi:hypothetical protein